MKIRPLVSVFPQMDRLTHSALALILLGLGLFPASAGAQAASGTFSAEEQRKLRAGRLVMRREMSQRGELRLIGGTAYQVVDAPPEQVWAAVMDTASYTEFLPRVVVSRTVRERAGQRLVYIEHRQGPVAASYHVRIDLLPQQHMARFRIDTSRPHSIQDGWGFFIVQPFGDDRSMVTFGIMADVGTGVVSGLMRPTLHEWMLRVPNELKKYVERLRRDS